MNKAQDWHPADIIAAIKKEERHCRHCRVMPDCGRQH